ncbi:ArsR/SmtB family transcription factor [Foetidibacter luteolus]|uniref:ArsR/SmtB family transcription factor n=1 Tax=Foetidibacter luteolus TaxID=2608880 RepID=UPI00129AA334|nr:metalloregulator ArsR/SmtB family transcription factor [Foetidibacter luteolus]
MQRDVFQAIADPTRRKIISMIAEQPMNINTLSAGFTISRAAVYKHIKILRESGLLVVRPRGRERYCVARLDKLEPVLDWLHQYAKVNALQPGVCKTETA